MNCASDALTTGIRGGRWLGVMMFVGLVGCSDPNAYERVPVYPVKGSVQLANGKPLTGGHVYFIPIQAKTIVAPNGPIQSDGTFQLSSADLGEGAPEGTYKVRIEPPQTAPARTSAKPLPLPPRPFKAKYTDEDTSQLIAKVEPKSNVLPPFVLK